MTDTSSALEPILSFLRQYQPFNLMQSVHQEYIAMYAEQVFYSAGDLIMSPADNTEGEFFIIKQGTVSFEQSNQEAVKETENRKLLQNGDCFPLPDLMEKQIVSVPYKAMKSTICYRLKQSQFDYLKKQSPVFKEFCINKSLKQEY